MTKRDKQIEERGIQFCKSQPVKNYFYGGAHWADTHPNWIDVNDELPPKVTNDGRVSKISIKVLVCCKGDKGQDMFILDWYDYEANDWVNADSSLVTHWMKIIPPQK